MCCGWWVLCAQCTIGKEAGRGSGETWGRTFLLDWLLASLRLTTLRLWLLWLLLLLLVGVVLCVWCV